jgi:hypothetical protein
LVAQAVPPDRRQFVRAALLTAASYGRILGANDRIRIGAIGTGQRGQTLLGFLNQIESNDSSRKPTNAPVEIGVSAARAGHVANLAMRGSGVWRRA